MNGNIPVLHVERTSLAETWEASLLTLYEKGCRIRTEYDAPEDPPSLDATMLQVVRDPASEPFIHRAFPGGLEDLEEYRQEVVDGIKDHWVRDPGDPNDTRWEYTYHERLFRYRVPGVAGPFDQVERIAARLSERPHSRRAQAITWKVWEDTGIDDPACLQSLWCRILPGEGGVWTLNMNVRFRSRDAYDAAFMNMFALIHLQEAIAARIAKTAGRDVRLGRYADLSDSYHVYGKRFGDFTDRFIATVKKRSLKERTWTREFAKPFFEEARPKIAEKVRAQDAKREKMVR